MKLSSLFIIVSSALTASAFGVQPPRTTTSALTQPTKVPKASTSSASNSPLFRQASTIRAGAVPGWAAYNDALDKKPLITKAFTSLVGWALGDFLTQTFIGSAAFDMKRFITLSLFGFLYHGPSGHFFYNWLDKQVEGQGAPQVALKVAIDQILWCPIFMSVFFLYLGLVNGDTLATVGKKIQSDLLVACQGSWKVWPLVHAVNFKFISTKHRLVFINAVQVAFNMFLSIIGTKK